jgi:hypothetical protein
VDESGQETQGRIFLVSVVVTGETREALRSKLKAIERASGKRDKKWTKARLAERAAYMQAIVQSSDFVDHIYYAHYQDTRSYVDLMLPLRHSMPKGLSVSPPLLLLMAWNGPSVPGLPQGCGNWASQCAKCVAHGTSLMS